MHPSYIRFKSAQLGILGRLSLFILRTFRLAEVREGIGEDAEYTAVSNLTIINLVILVCGPMNEGTLTTVLLLLQVGPVSRACSCFTMTNHYETRYILTQTNYVCDTGRHVYRFPIFGCIMEGSYLEIVFSKILSSKISSIV